MTFQFDLDDKRLLTLRLLARGYWKSYKAGGLAPGDLRLSTSHVICIICVYFIFIEVPSNLPGTVNSIYPLPLHTS